MGAPAGCCGSCVFTRLVGEERAKKDNCNIERDPEVKATYREIDIKGSSTYGGICGKYQLNPAALNLNA